MVKYTNIDGVKSPYHHEDLLRKAYSEDDPRNNIKCTIGLLWMRIKHDRDKWKQMMAYVPEKAVNDVIEEEEDDDNDEVEEEERRRR